jgi:hypothetical protein
MSRPYSVEAELSLSLSIEPKIKRSCLAARFEQQGPVYLHASFACLYRLSKVSSTRRFALGFAFHYETLPKRGVQSRFQDAMGVCDLDQLRYRPIRQYGSKRQ